MTPGRSVCAIAVVTIGLTSSARAQSAEAETLFREGRKLIKDGKIVAGCDKLEASEKLEASIGTLLNLGDCKEKLGKLASAWGAFTKAEAIAKRGGDDKRQAEAHRRAAAIEPRLAMLVIDVPQRVDGLVVRRDGEVVEPAIWHVPVPVDPGTYKLVAEAPGFVVWRGEVSIDGGRRAITVPALERVPVPRVEEPAAAPPITPAPVLIMREPERSRATFTGLRKLSVGLAVAGAGALGGGVYFSVHARDVEDEANKLCPTTTCADPTGLQLNRTAERSARTANIFYIAGGSSVAAALLLWLVGGPGGDHATVTPTIGAGRIGISYARSL